MTERARQIAETVREIKKLGKRIGCDFIPDDVKLRGNGLSEAEIRQVRLLSRN